MVIVRRTSWYFLSSLGVPLLGLATLPLFTTRLGPEEYGIFALGAALAGIVSATAGAFSMVSLPTELPKLAKADRPPYLTSVLMLSSVASLLTCIVVFLLFGAVTTALDLELLDRRAIALASAAAILQGVWATCVEIHTIEGRARIYAITTVAQALANAAAVSVALFAFNEVQLALFWGFLATGCVGIISAWVSLKGKMTLRGLHPWFGVAARGSVASIVSALTENGKFALERTYLGALIGIASLGLYAHAQYYRNASMTVLNALSRGVLPTALREAQLEPPQFDVTLKLWVIVQAFVICVALGFSLVGGEIIALLTHGKFVSAAPYAIALMAVLLLQTAAKPQAILLTARGQGHVLAHLGTLSILLSLVWLIVAVPLIGIWGAVSSFFVQILAHRIAVYRAARRIHTLPFSDTWLVAGFLLLLGCVLLETLVKPSLTQRVALLAVLYAAILFRLRPSLALMWAARHSH